MGASVTAIQPSFDGRVLFLSQDAGAMRRQLAGDYLTLDEAQPLLDNVTIEDVVPDLASVLRGGFAVAVAGHGYGRGAAGEAGPHAERLAGIRLVVARSFERRYRRHCHHLGMLTSTDLGLVERIRNGETIPIEEFMRGADEATAQVIRRGGLIGFARARLAGEITDAPARDAAQPMTYAEKILARARGGRRAPVRPGDTLFARADWRSGPGDVPPLAMQLLEREMGTGVALHQPRSIAALADHAEPGQLVVGAGAHGAQCGALGALALRVSACEMAMAWLTGEVLVAVPPTCRVRLHGPLPQGVDATDVVHHLLRREHLRHGRAAGQVIEFSGDALLDMDTGDRATLTAMAVGLGAFCGIVAPDAGTLAFLRQHRGLAMALDPWMRSDPDADFAHTIEVDCAALEAELANAEASAAS
jgi:3-isopropylmalate/(R)-2-methylmalate dehydratase large subunit